MEYWEKKYRDLEKKQEKDDAFVNGCLPLVIVVIVFIIIALAKV